MLLRYGLRATEIPIQNPYIPEYKDRAAFTRIAALSSDVGEPR